MRGCCINNPYEQCTYDLHECPNCNVAIMHNYDPDPDEEYERERDEKQYG